MTLLFKIEECGTLPLATLPPGRGTVALWSSIRPDWNRIMSEKKSSSGTVAPLFEAPACGAGASDSTSTAGAGSGDRWSSSRDPWHRTN